MPEQLVLNSHAGVPKMVGLALTQVTEASPGHGHRN
jgi:hypothetical protein